MRRSAFTSTSCECGARGFQKNTTKSMRPSAIAAPTCWSPPSGPLRKRFTGRSSSPAMSAPVVPVAYSSCRESVPRLNFAHSSRSAFLLSCAMSAIRLGAILLDLPLHEVEQLVVQLREPFRRQRPAIAALEVLQHPLLPCEVDEADAVLLLVSLQLRHEAQALVHEFDERAVDIGDLAPQVAHERIGRGRDVGAHDVTCAASYTPTMRCDRVRLASSSNAPRTFASSGCPATTASKR